MARTPHAMIDGAAIAAERMKTELRDANNRGNALADAVESITRRLHLPTLAGALETYRAAQRASVPPMARPATMGGVGV